MLSWAVGNEGVRWGDSTQAKHIFYLKHTEKVDVQTCDHHAKVVGKSVNMQKHNTSSPLQIV